MYWLFRNFIVAVFVAVGLAITFAYAPAVGGFGWFSGVVGTGDRVRASRELPSFHAVTVNGSTDVNVSVGGPQSVAVEAQPNIAGLIETSVEDGRLYVTSHGSYRTTKKPILWVTVPEFDGITIRGSSDVTVQGARGADLDVAIYGSGDVRASGNVERLSFSSSGSGDGRLRDLRVRDAVVRLRGSGAVKLNVAGTLDVEVSGSGKVRYTGFPRIVNQSVHGSGSVAAD